MAAAAAALCSGTSALSSNFVGSDRSVTSDSSSSEASSSDRVVDGPRRVRFAVGASHRSSKESKHTSLSISSCPALSSTCSSEWWRKCVQNVSQTKALGTATEREGMVSGPSVADWQLDEATWMVLPLKNTPSRGTSGGVPVFVMLPLDSVNMTTKTVNRKRAMNGSLLALKNAGVEGIMMDLWWGIVEKGGPMQYNWSPYRDLIEMAKNYGLKVQAVMSFHQCGGNVGDSCNIPLPHWVVEELQANNDMAYTDKFGNRNYEYLSLGVDELPVLKGRSPVQVYGDLMRSFRDSFSDLLGETIVEIQVGMGPAGELRYPGYPEQNGKWRFPGIGAFQCHDKYMLANLKACAEAIGKPDWGNGGPSDAGDYNSWPNDTPFFCRDGGWNSAYGEFFLHWYSEMLLSHGERILSEAEGIFSGTGVYLSGKVAGIHWHYGTRSHAAELTAGYYNTRIRDGYLPIAHMFGRHGVTFNFTCIEMKDEEQPAHALCSPEGLLRQVTVACRTADVRLAGENALPRFDQTAYDQVVTKSRLQLDTRGDKAEEQEPMCAFTFLRMCERLFDPENWPVFVLFVGHMQEGRTFQQWQQKNRETESLVRDTVLLERGILSTHH